MTTLKPPTPGDADRLSPALPVTPAKPPPPPKPEKEDGVGVARPAALAVAVAAGAGAPAVNEKTGATGDKVVAGAAPNNGVLVGSAPFS